MLLTFLFAAHLAADQTLGNETATENSRRLVFANHYALQWSVASPVPSGEISLFAGSSIRPRFASKGRVWRSALGYELGISGGGADRATAFLSWGGNYGVVYHRHHFACLGYGGPLERLFYQFGGGVLIWRTTPMALETDVRLGVVLGLKNKTRIKGVVGGEARVVMIFGGLPLPQFGIFAGLFLF